MRPPARPCWGPSCCSSQPLLHHQVNKSNTSGGSYIVIPREAFSHHLAHRVAERLWINTCQHQSCEYCTAVLCVKCKKLFLRFLEVCTHIIIFQSSLELKAASWKGSIFHFWFRSRSVSETAFAVFCQQRIPRTKPCLECRFCFEATSTHFHCLCTRSRQDRTPHFSPLYNLGKKTHKATFETLPFFFHSGLPCFPAAGTFALLVFEQQWF